MGDNDGIREEIERMHALLKVDPGAYVRFYTEQLVRDPNDSSTYFSRHFGWEQLGRFDQALADLDRSLELEPSCVALQTRGELYVELGRLHEAKADFLRGQALDNDEWREIFGHISLALCHALLGEERAAMSICDSLPQDHWSPPLQDLVRGGGKAIVVDSIRKILDGKR
jgi:tetratricopeptide (TPR) repeat protein